MKVFAKEEVRLLGAFYLERFLSHLIYFVPAFWIVFFGENLNLTQIGILFSIASISAFIFEVPTGSFADLFGRKASTLFAYFFLGITLVLFIFIKNFYLLAILFFLWGFFGTFYSGAREAWIVDNLKYYKRNDLIEEYFLKEYSLIRAGMFLSGIIGAYIVAVMGIKSIWLFASLSWFLSFILILPVKEHKLTKEKKLSFKKLRLQSKDSIKFSIKHKALLFIIIASFFIMIRETFVGDIIWQSFLTENGLPIYALGIIYSGTMLLGILAPFISKKLKKKYGGEKEYLILLMVIGIILNITIFFANSYFIGIIIILMIFFFIDLFNPINEAFTQKFVPSKKRATINSFRNMIVSLAYSISYPLVGLIADNIGTKNTLIFGGIFLIPAIYLYNKIR